MKIYIDQSGKIEQTNKPTVVALSNSLQKGLYISSTSKREIQRVFREAHKPKLFVYRTFGILIYLLVEEYLDKLETIIIDTEYLGYESLIKDTLLQNIRRKRKKFRANNIQFERVTKKHKCHEIAIRIFRGERQPDIEVREENVLKYML